MSQKDIDIVILKFAFQKANAEGAGSSESLRDVNDDSKVKVVALEDKVEDLTQ